VARLDPARVFRNRTQFMLSVGGVALALLLMLSLDALLAGSEKDLVAYIEGAGANIFVAQDGVKNMHMASSAITYQDMRRAAHAPGVRLRRIGFIFQDFNLLSALSCLDNVAMVGQLNGLPRREARKHARVLLEQLGLGHRLNFLPKKLSGGEKQRVAIARSLINKPDIILADEPTANLDSHHGHETMRLLRRIAKEENRSVIIVSHDQRIRDIADRVYWLEDGEFKNMVEMALDPVCQMSVDRESAPARAEWGGITYYFCANGCREVFLKEPEIYLL